MPHDVFVSYSTIDRAAAFAACATFEAAQIRCWIAPRDVAPGSEWAEEIINAIESARIMVLIFSANSNESRQVKREIELAVSRGLTIMPIRLEQIAPTKSMAYYMAGVHWLDALTPPLDAHFKQMVGWIKPHLKGGPAPEPPPKAKTDTKLPPRPAAKPAAAKLRRKSSSILGDVLFEFFGVGATPGAIKIKESGAAIDAANKLLAAGKHSESIDANLALIERIEDADAPSLDLNLATAHLNLGVAYRAAGRNEEALKAYRGAVRSCGDIADQMVERRVAMAMNNEASLLIDMKRASEAIPLQNEVIHRWGETINTDLAQQVAVARLNRGVAFAAMNRSGESISAFDDVIGQTNLRVWPKFDEYVAHALINKGARLAALGSNDDAVAAYDDAISRIGSAPDDLRRRLVAMAVRNRIVALLKAGRKTEAAKASDQMIADFGQSTDRAIAEQVSVVRNLRVGA